MTVLEQPENLRLEEFIIASLGGLLPCNPDLPSRRASYARKPNTLRDLLAESTRKNKRLEQQKHHPKECWKEGARQLGALPLPPL